jgi:hypothetical protein
MIITGGPTTGKTRWAHVHQSQDRVVDTDSMIDVIPCDDDCQFRLGFAAGRLARHGSLVLTNQVSTTFTRAVLHQLNMHLIAAGVTPGKLPLLVFRDARGMARHSTHRAERITQAAAKRWVSALGDVMTPSSNYDFVVKLEGDEFLGDVLKNYFPVMNGHRWPSDITTSPTPLAAWRKP